MHLTLNIINSSGLQTMFSYDEFKDKCRESMETVVQVQVIIINTG